MAGSSFKTEHHYAAGIVLLGIGVLGMAGSLTGSLAAMMAGLWDRSALQSATPSSTLGP